MDSDFEPNGYYAHNDPLKGVYYGPGCLKDALPKLINTLGVHKALVVTGRSLHTKTDVVRKVEQVLSAHNAYASTFWEIGEHSPVAGINAGLNIFVSSGADFIVSVGGGSPIDASKAMIYRFHERKPGSGWLKHVAVPTTLSAAEYTAGAGYTNEQGEKVSVAELELAPSGIILDAELTLATPERLWLSTGMRAVDHAVENLYRPVVPYPLKVLCYDALATFFSLLPLCKSDSNSSPSSASTLAIRQKLQVASWMSIWPLKLENRGALGLSHSLGHRLGAKYGIPHGITSCLTLAPVVALQARSPSALTNEQKHALARALFYIQIKSTEGAVVEEDIELLAHAIEKLVERLGLKSELRQWNVPREDLPKIAEGALGGTIGKGKEDERYESVVKMLEGMYPE